MKRDELLEWLEAWMDEYTAGEYAKRNKRQCDIAYQEIRALIERPKVTREEIKAWWEGAHKAGIHSGFKIFVGWLKSKGFEVEEIAACYKCDDDGFYEADDGGGNMQMHYCDCARGDELVSQHEAAKERKIYDKGERS